MAIIDIGGIAQHITEVDKEINKLEQKIRYKRNIERTIFQS